MVCIKSFAKFVIITINLVLLVGSIIMMSFGIAANMNPEGVASIFNYVLPATARVELQHAGVDLTGVVIDNAVFMIVVGVVGIVCSGFGCFGACCMIKWMLGLYAILVSCLLLAEIALIIFASVYPNKFKSFIQESMFTTLTNGFQNEIYVNGTNSVVMPTGVVELAWASIQLKESCCGAKNWNDYSKLSNWNKTRLVPTSLFSGTPAVPISCCKQTDSTSRNQIPPSLQSFTDLSKCLGGDPKYINQQTCFDTIEGDIEEFIRNYKGIAIGIAASVAGLQILLVFFSIYLCRTSSKHVYVKFV